MSCLRWLQGRLIVYYENSFFRTAARHADVPEMTPQQAAAIEAFDALADSDELRIDYVLQPGDIQLLHNHSVVHARTEYTDFDAVSVLSNSDVAECQLPAATQRHPYCPLCGALASPPVVTASKSLVWELRSTLDMLSEAESVPASCSIQPLTSAHLLLQSQNDDLKRHLMRLWISPENDWELPQGFASRWNGLTPGQRGGIVISGSEPRAPLDAEPYW